VDFQGAVANLMEIGDTGADQGLPAIAFADGDAPNFGNCAPTGEAGSISLTTVEPIP
jgi:hypothetical protein